jgi:hypothetical protein
MLMCRAADSTLTVLLNSVILDFPTFPLHEKRFSQGDRTDRGGSTRMYLFGE